MTARGIARGHPSVLCALIAFVFSLLGGPAFAAPLQSEALQRAYEVSFNVPIPVRDGVKLNAVIVRPAKQTARLPVILTFTPYGADRFYPLATMYARNGYVAAIVEVRGRGDSEGVYEPYIRDAQDGYDVVEWIAKQPFADGRVAMRGSSYTGFLQWAIAALRPPALKTIIPGAPPYHGVDSPDYRGVGLPYRMRWVALVAGRQRNSNFNEDLAYWNGLFAEAARGEIDYQSLDVAAGLPTPYWKQLLSPDARENLRALNPTPAQLAAINIPILTVTGAYDGAQLGTLEHYRRLLRANPGAAKTTYTLMGPWDHAGVASADRDAGGLDFGPDAAINTNALHLAWFNWVLKGAPKPALLKGQSTFYVLGSNAWRGADTLWPISSPTRYYLSGSGTAPQTQAGRGGLLLEPPKGDAHRFIYDPRRPPVSWGPYNGAAAGGANFLLNDPVADLMGGQGLIYETRPLTAAMDLIGQPELNLDLMLDVPDTDLTAVLYDVDPKGNSVTLAYDALRLRYRDGPDAPARLMTPGRREKVGFQLGWIGRRIEAGHALRLVITSPGISFHFQRNGNTGGNVAAERREAFRPATVQVLVGRSGSHLNLPLQPAVNQPVSATP